MCMWKVCCYVYICVCASKPCVARAFMRYMCKQRAHSAVCQAVELLLASRLCAAEQRTYTNQFCGQAQTSFFSLSLSLLALEDGRRTPHGFMYRSRSMEPYMCISTLESRDFPCPEIVLARRCACSCILRTSRGGRGHPARAVREIARCWIVARVELGLIKRNAERKKKCSFLAAGSSLLK